ncbi:hypothetical protein HH308_08130 [Gordonia sp. TBRC 11910]|uniref:Uncharacterized protein n=1 Tax=Gordonia asplenii TaxID=2725283 RepID=A0A848KQ96_9ACTN|nr:hypothetical protein [Gordonia asplenii]NMO01184.1 hypothetical protein [Gordonia asplenii]
MYGSKHARQLAAHEEVVSMLRVHPDLLNTARNDLQARIDRKRGHASGDLYMRRLALWEELVRQRDIERIAEHVLGTDDHCAMMRRAGK